MRWRPTASRRRKVTRTDQPRSRAPRRAIDGILLLDKPLGLSSNQALQQVRRLFEADKAGHTGSLDPLATGMLPVCFGEATKLCGLLLESDKTYLARVSLGSRTSTGDAEGEVIATSEPAGVGVGDFEAVKSRFLGPILQVPPMYSALKHEGRRLYELARAGTEVERAPRQVHIHALDFRLDEEGLIEATVTCSKGTYIRTLVEDLAAALGQCAHLAGLRRTCVGPFSSARMWTVDELAQLAARDRAELDSTLLPLSCAVRHWPQVRLSPEALHRIWRGQAIDCAQPPDAVGEVPVAVMDGAGMLRAVGQFGPDGRLSPKRWLGGTIAA